MANFLVSQECGPYCQEEAEFSVKLVVTKLQLTDKDKGQGFDEILLAITFDGNVFKIDSFLDNDEGEMKSTGCEMVFQTSPEQFSKKLGTVPIMFDLSRACNELGTVKLDIRKCFVDAVMCEEFSSETSTVDLLFVKNEKENATMTLVFKIVRTLGDAANKSLYKGYRKKSGEAKKALAKKRASIKKNPDGRKDLTVVPNEADDDLADNVLLSFTDSSDLSLDCDTDLCPLNEQSNEISPSAFSQLTSPNSKSIRCCSDIAQSLDLQDCFDRQKTFCGGCGEFSVSGITCDRHKMFPIASKAAEKESYEILVKSTCKSPSATSIKKFGISVNRICSECFEDLRVIPRNAPCPKCAHQKQLQRKLVSLRSSKAKNKQAADFKDCIKSVFEEIFMETKNKLITDWNRLNQKKKPKKTHKKSNKSKRTSIRKNSIEFRVKPLKRCSNLDESKKKRRRVKIFSLCKKNPGVVVGHKMCIGSGLLVPKNMGWLWNVGITGLPTFRRGWRPGAIKTSVATIMKYYLKPAAEQAMILPGLNPPTLRVQKKEGDYTIIMNPLRDDSNGIKNSTPVVFKVVKSDDAKKRSIARKILKTRGVEKSCDCDDIEKCLCLTTCDKAQIMFELQEISTRLFLKPEMNFCDLKDSSESEIDVEFTPPFAKKQENQCKAVKKSYAGTQYEMQLDDFSYDKRETSNEKISPKGDKIVVNRNKAETTKAGDKKAKTTKGDVGELEVENSADSIKSKTRPKRKKQVVKMMKALPSPKGCCSCTVTGDYHSASQQNENFRFTTNYNPLYAQCPPQPPVCGNPRYMPIEMFHQAF